MSEKKNRDILEDQDESTEESEGRPLEADVGQDQEARASSTEGNPLNTEFPQDKPSSSLDEKLSITPNLQSEEKDNTLKVSEPTAEAVGKMHSDSLESPLEPERISTIEGATGGKRVETSDSAVRELNKQASALDRSALLSGKLDVFQRYFNEDGLQFHTLPENRKRHNAVRQRKGSDEGFPKLDQKPSDENPLRHLQTLEPEPEPLLNQAGAIVGTVSSRASRFLESKNNDPLAGFGYVADAEHSLGSAETMPIGEIYSGNFSPVRPSSEISSRGLSPGSSFPSFSSRPQTSPEFEDPKISPLPNEGYRIGTKRASPTSTDSDSLSAERPPVRRRRPGRPIKIPKRSDSALAGSEGSNSDEPKFENDRKKVTYAVKNSSDSERKASKYSLTSTGELSSLSKESSVDIDAHMTQRQTGSEDDASTNPELSQSAESDDCLPIPDLTSDASKILHDNLRVSAEMQAEHAPKLESEGSECEQEPVSVLSCSPESKNLEQDEPDEETREK